VSPANGPRSLRVEQALQLLPDIDALLPLRAFVVRSSRDPAPEEPYRTVGKRFIQSQALKEFVPRAVARASEHLTALYRSAVDALEAEENGDMPGVVRCLLTAGEEEERVGRPTQARAWYEHALRVAEGLRERRPEIHTLRHLGHLEEVASRNEGAARFYQRSLVLAEGELDSHSAARACQGLGDVAQAQGKWQGASSWYTRGMQYVESDLRLKAALQLALGEVARAKGQLDGAEELFQQALAWFDQLGDGEGAARVLNAWGILEGLRVHHVEALARFSEALAKLRDTEGAPALEMEIRLNVCELHLEWGRLPDAEDEIRRAEELAIERNLVRQLARLYVVMGKVRGRQRDESGFVFFEKAIELCRGQEPWPRLEAEVYLEYALFRKDLGDNDECRAYLERAHEVFEAVGDGSELARVDGELARIQTG
jgi:tetratricopeptide (TPR) repeat protein